MPVSPIPTFPRKRGKGQTNRYASFTSNRLIRKARILADLGGVRRTVIILKKQLSTKSTKKHEQTEVDNAPFGITRLAFVSFVSFVDR